MEGVIILNQLEVFPYDQLCTAVKKDSSSLNGIQLIELFRQEPFLKIISLRGYIFLLILSEEINGLDFLDLQNFLLPFLSQITTLDLLSIHEKGLDLSNTCHSTCRQLSTHMGITHIQFPIVSDGLLQKGQTHSLLRTNYGTRIVIIDPTLSIRKLYDPQQSQTYNLRQQTISPLVFIGNKKFIINRLRRYYHPNKVSL